MGFWKKSLTARLVVNFFLLSLVTVSLVGYIAFRLSRDALTQAVFNQLETTATLKENELNRWVADQRQDVLLIAALPEVRTQAALLLNHAESEPEYQSAYTLLSEHLANVSARKLDLQEIFILSDKGGQILISTNKAHEGEHHDNLDYFTHGRLGLFLKNVYSSPITHKPAMTIATPLLNKVGRQLRGVLAVHLNLDRMDKIILQHKGLRAGSETYLMDRSSVFISADRFGKEDFSRGVHTEGIDAALQGKDGSGLYMNYKRVPVIGVYRWLDRWDMALLAEMHQSEAFAPARRLALTIVLVGLISAGILAVGVYILARRIARPILAITDTARQLADGDLTLTAPVLTEDEIGVLARTFNEMTGQLYALYKELRRSEDKYRTLVEQARDGIVIVQDTLVEFVNIYGAHKLGYTTEEMLGNSITSYAHPDALEKMADRYKRSMAGEDLPMVYETALNHRDGSRVEVELSGGMITYRGKPADLIIMRDITERKQAEAELTIYRDHLEDLVAQRTKELAKKAQELEEANIRLQEADRLKSVFLASMSHELRTPLNSIIGFTGIILQGMAGEINEEQRKQLSMAKNSAVHLLSLINDLLDIAKIEAGRVDLSLEKFDIYDVITEVMETFSPVVEEKGLELTADVPEGIALESDRRRIKQILMNFVSNAVKFTDQGSVRLAVNVLENINLQMSVTDTGIGIKTEDMDRLFKPFQQVDSSLAKRHEGTGLGLHHSKKLAELLGGEVTAKSEPGKGSEFTFTVPCHSSES